MLLLRYRCYHEYFIHFCFTLSTTMNPSHMITHNIIKYRITDYNNKKKYYIQHFISHFIQTNTRTHTFNGVIMIIVNKIPKK